MEGQAEGGGHLGQLDHAGVEVGGQPVGLVGAEALDRLLDTGAPEVDDRSEPIEEVGHLRHSGDGGVDQPQQIAEAGGRFGQLHDRHTARPVSHCYQRPRPAAVETIVPLSTLRC